MAFDRFSWREGLFNVLVVVVTSFVYYVVSEMTVEGIFQDANILRNLTVAGGITLLIIFLLTSWIEGSMKGLSTIRGR